jgi:hypothetical protein
MSSTGSLQDAKIIEGIQQTDLRYSEDPHEYHWKGNKVPYLTGILKDLGFAPDYKFCHPDHLSWRATVGRAFHHAAHLLVTDKLDPSWSDPEVDPYVVGLRNFWKESGATPLAAEVSLYNTHHSYACTVDSVWMLNGFRSIIEYKTSDSVIPSEEYQTWGQELAWNDVVRALPIEKRFSLHVRKNGRYSLTPWERSPYGFGHMLWMWNEVRRNGRNTHV